MLHKNTTGKIIKAFYEVNNKLGFGFLEKVYENAMAIELGKIGCTVSKQKNIKVYYDKEEVGDYYADLIVDDLVIVELKVAETICEHHEFQLINYLKATQIEVGILLNFGKKAEFRRKIFILKPIWFSVLPETKSWLQLYSLHFFSDFIRKPL
ncbi:MAG: GxxExxY protein [Candidatus Scalindua sp.]|nr:GxxExxY protein [Candidatus Scalindua sp.]